MNLLSKQILAAAAAFTLALGSSAVFAAGVVNVTLWDKGAAMAMRTDMSYTMPGMDMSMATMGIKAEPATTKTGVISFHVTNSSTDTIHEMIVIALEDPSKPLPYIASESRVDEDHVGDKGEVSELDPGGSGTLSVFLKPGKYLLICNVAGHFAAGMWTEFVVTP